MDRPDELVLYRVREELQIATRKTNLGETRNLNPVAVRVFALSNQIEDSVLRSVIRAVGNLLKVSRR